MIDILAREGDIILVRKPCGTSSQPGERAGRDIVSLAEDALGSRPWPLHRLDRDTEGVLALAMSREAAAAWSAAMEGGASSKRYLAVVAGKMGSAAGRIDTQLIQRGKTVSALTHWRLLASFDLPEGGSSLLEVELGTGRMHQIRIHLASLGHPILGDDRHGNFALNKAARKAHGLRKLLLLGRELRIKGPFGSSVGALCPLPTHFLEFLSQAAPGLDIEALEGRTA